MRQHIDLAVLPVNPDNLWFETVLDQATPALAKMTLHRLDWVDAQPEQANHRIPIQCFAQNAIHLKRFDICVIPVSMQTLGWTRQALAAIPRGPFIPLFGVFDQLKAASMQDLLELGMVDFVRLPLCQHELRARLLSAIIRTPRHTRLREPVHASEYNTHMTKLAKEVRRLTPKGVRSMSFKDAKQAVVDHFEQDYINALLSRHEGNIAMAARAAQKHRRAFWELMRKHKINAELFRQDL